MYAENVHDTDKYQFVLLFIFFGFGMAGGIVMIKPFTITGESLGSILYWFIRYKRR